MKTILTLSLVFIFLSDEIYYLQVRWADPSLQEAHGNQTLQVSSVSPSLLQVRSPGAAHEETLNSSLRGYQKAAKVIKAAAKVIKAAAEVIKAAAKVIKAVAEVIKKAS